MTALPTETDRVSDERREEPHLAAFLENRYLRIMVLPRFGGRIQSAHDKTNGYRPGDPRSWGKARLRPRPTTNTTTAPITLCQR